MKILNFIKGLKIKNYTLVSSITELPDLVLVKNNHKKLNEISLNFLTAIVGRSDLKTIDYEFDDENTLLLFLENYSKKTVRERLAEFYNRFYNLNELKPANVNFIYYFGNTLYTYKKLETLLNSSYTPWILIYGQRGVGKLTIIKSLLNRNYVDYFEVEEKPAGFRTNLKGEQSIILNVDLFEDEFELNFAINYIYKIGARVVFITDKIIPPSNLSTIPSIYIPSIAERNNKEKMLILEHFLRRISNNFVEIEEDFFKAYLVYPWFGNFSEIENAIRYALSLDSKVLKFENLPDHIKEQFDEMYNFKVADYFAKLMVLNFRNITYDELKFLIGQEFINVIQFLYEVFESDVEKLFETLKVEKKEDKKEIMNFLGIASTDK